MNVYAKKIGALVVGLLLTVVLLLLPTTVVNDKKLEALDDPQQPLNTFDHQTKRLDSDRRIDSLRRIFKVDSEATRSALYEALISAFEVDKRYDSALVYMNWLYKVDSSLQNLTRLSDLYFQAFTFAIQKERVEFFRKQAQTYLQKLAARSDNETKAEVQVQLGLTYVSSSEPMRGISHDSRCLK